MKRTNQAGFSMVEALLILVVVGILGFTGWYVNHVKQTSDKNYSAASSAELLSSVKQTKTLHGTKIVSLDATYEKYINYDTGVSLTYSKMVASRAKCLTTPQIQPATDSVPVKVYEDTANDKVFVAASKYADAQNHQISPGLYQGYDSCTVKDVTLGDIEKPVSSTIPQSTVLYVEFDYAHVAYVAGLDAFVAAHTPIDGLVIDHAVAPYLSGGVDTYKLKVSGSAVDTTKYFLKYNPSKKLAVFWASPNQQDVGWEGENSTGGYFDVNIPVADLSN